MLRALRVLRQCKEPKSEAKRLDRDFHFIWIVSKIGFCVASRQAAVGLSVDLHISLILARSGREVLPRDVRACEGAFEAVVYRLKQKSP